MNERQLAQLGERMRAAQQKYFRTRSADDLAESKRLERLFDVAVHDTLRQPTLFDRTFRPEEP
jgi:hypothetical protein